MSTIKLRRDTAANWLAANPVLASSEPGFETDTGFVKYGDGTSVWSALPYSGATINGRGGSGHQILTDRGTLRIGDSDAPTGNSHFHIRMDQNPSETFPGGIDLFFGDDSQFLRLANDGSVAVQARMGSGAPTIVTGAPAEFTNNTTSFEYVYNLLDGTTATTVVYVYWDGNPIADGDIVTFSDSPVTELNNMFYAGNVTTGTYVGSIVLYVDPELLTPADPTSWATPDGGGTFSSITLPGDAVLSGGADTTDLAYTGDAVVAGKNVYIDAGMNEWKFGSDGAINLTNHGVIRNTVDSHEVNIVSSEFAQLQWTTNAGVAEADPNNTNSATNWLYVEQGGIFIETNINGTGNSNRWQYRNDGGLRFPDNTVQHTAYTGQSYGGQVWVSEFTGTNFNYLVSSITSVQYDSNNNILATANLVTDGPDHTAVIKLSPNGQILWEQSYGENLNCDGWGLAVDSNDDVYIAGSNGFGNGGGLFIVKISGQSGDGMWGKELTSSYQDLGWVTEVGPDNDPVIVGFAKNSNSDKDTIITKFSSTGTNLWQTIVGDVAIDEEAYGIAVGPNNEIVAVGHANDGTSASSVLLVIKLDSDGVVLWQNEYHYDDNFDSIGVDADIDSTGNIYISASFGGPGGGSGALFTTMKLDSSGAILWARDIPGPCGSAAGALAVGPDDNIYITVDTVSEITSSTQVLIGSYNSSGVERWQKRFNLDLPYYLLNVGNNSFFNGTPTGSNIDVQNGHVVVSGSLIHIANGGPDYTSSKGWVTQFNMTGDSFVLGDYILDNSTLTDEANTYISITTSTKAVSTGTLTVSPFEPMYNQGGLIQSYYGSNINIDSNRLVNGSYNVVLDSSGALNLPSNQFIPGPGTIQTLDGYPTLLAYGSSGPFGIHGGPELDWMNSDYPTEDFFNTATTRHSMYLNGGGLYVGMNENGVSDHPAPSWNFNPDGTTAFPNFTITTSTGTTGTVLTLDGDGNASWQTPAGGSGTMSSFGTDQGIGSTYESGSPVLFTNDDMLIRTGGTAANEGGGYGQMYIMSAEDITIGTAINPADLTDATSGVECDAKVHIVPGHYNVGGNSTVEITAGSNTLSVDSTGGLTYNGSVVSAALANYVEDGTTYSTLGVGNQLEYGGYVWVNSDGGIGMFGGTGNRIIVDDTNASNAVWISTGDASLTGGTPSNYGYNWKFGGADGILTFPSSSGLTIEPNSGSPIFRSSNDLNFTTDGSSWNMNLSSNNGALTIPGTIQTSGGPNNVYIAAGDYTTQFSTTGDIQVPGSITAPYGKLMDNGAGIDIFNDVNTYGSVRLNYLNQLYVALNSNGVVVTNNSSSWTFTESGTIQYPDQSQQSFAPSIGVGPLHPYAAPFPSTGGVAGTDYQFFFDIGNNGYPSMQSYSSAGGYPTYNTIWSVEYWIDSLNSANTVATSSGAIPVAVNNTGGVVLVGTRLLPGDYVVARVQNLDTGRVYRATFLGSYNVSDEGNETQYGSIIVERLV